MIVSRKVISKLAVNWTASFVSVLLLISMLALPALAVVAANSVDSSAIINGQVKTPDLAGNAVTSAKIKNGQVKKADIAVGAVASGRIANSAVTSAKIRNGTIISADVNSIRDSKIRYSTKTRHLGLSMAAFTPMTNQFNYVNFGFGMMSESGAFIAPVSLPDGARVTRLRATYIDTSPTGNLQVGLFRYNYPGVSRQDMSNVLTSSGTSGNWRHLIDNTINFAVIDNVNNSYFVMVTTGPGLGIGKALVTYKIKGP